MRSQAQSRTARRRGLRGRSLRFQIVAMLLVLLAVIFAAVAAVAAIELRGFLLQRLDQQLAAAGDRYSIGLEHPGDHDADNSPQLGVVEGQAAGTLGARVLNGRVTVAVIVPHDPDDLNGPTVDAAARRELAGLKPSARPSTIHLSSLGDYRVLVTSGDDGDLLITGLPEHPVDDTIARLVAIEAVVFGVALVVTGSIAAASVRVSLRPLNRVAATAHEVSGLPLSTGTVSLPERVLVSAPATEAGQVADAFNSMLEHVESALHERHASADRLRRFVADASHELRTPVAVIRSHAEYAQRVGEKSVPAAVTDALSRITAESDRMGHLVDDLLLLARLDSGRELEQVHVDLTRIVLDTVGDARVTAPEHRWQLDLPEAELHVRGDPRALHQVLANLLANAATHTPSGTTVLTSLVGRADEVLLTVADDGPGIADEVLPRVFDRFVRADDARSGPEGSGLGLSIVDAIVTAHHGSLHVVSRPGATTFTVTLPGPGSLGPDTCDDD